MIPDDYTEYPELDLTRAAPDTTLAQVTAQRDALAAIVERVLELHDAGREPWLGEIIGWRKVLRESK